MGVRSSNGSAGHEWAIQLLAGGQLLNEITGQITDTELGIMKPVSGSYMSPSRLSPNQELEIRLVMVEGGPQLAFDLVRVFEED